MPFNKNELEDICTLAEHRTKEAIIGGLQLTDNAHDAALIAHRVFLTSLQTYILILGTSVKPEMDLSEFLQPFKALSHEEVEKLFLEANKEVKNFQKQFASGANVK